MFGYRFTDVTSTDKFHSCKAAIAAKYTSPYTIIPAPNFLSMVIPEQVHPGSGYDSQNATYLENGPTKLALIPDV